MPLLATVLLVIVMVILPLILISAALGQQASRLVDMVQTGELDFSFYLQRILDGRLKATGHKNLYFPLLIPAGFLEREAEHIDGFAKE